MENKLSLLKTQAAAEVDALQKKLIGLGDFLFDHPEPGFQEKKAVQRLTEVLSANGFLVECPYAGLQTAFRGVYEHGKGGPHIGLLCEYDALKNIGHACGHHLQSPAVLGAALAIQKVLGSSAEPFVLEVIGTPGEECPNGGKNLMLEQGAFKELDAALMMHVADSTTTDVHSLARSEYQITFHGKAAHAAIAPDKGRSALEAVMLAFNGLSFMRGHVKDDTRIGAIVVDGGKLINVVPEEAAMRLELRSYDSIYLESVIAWAKKILEGAALMTGTTFSIERIGGSLSKIPVIGLNNLLRANAAAAGARNMAPPREKTGSTDFASVMFHVPGSCIRVAFIEKGYTAHSQEWLAQGKTQEAYEAMITGAKTLAMTALDLILQKEVLQQVKDEFQTEKTKVLQKNKS